MPLAERTNCFLSFTAGITSTRERKCSWNMAQIRAAVKFGSHEIIWFNRLDSMSSIKCRHHRNALELYLDYILNLAFSSLAVCGCCVRFFSSQLKSWRKNFAQCLTFPHREHALKFQTNDVHKHAHLNTHRHILGQYLHTEWEIGSERGIEIEKESMNKGKGREEITKLTLPEHTLDSRNFRFYLIFYLFVCVFFRSRSLGLLFYTKHLFLPSFAAAADRLLFLL